ncbi:hypothetical protein A3B57_03580 [Microgenomates group bacterium RIFCSPLOWO2_01_FULL_47_10]|nr:MAG: hypothetical protein A3B57_03580 [Microgenomates group bacterium RIFCSPLOWO2_01_FULL_47_10]
MDISKELEVLVKLDPPDPPKVEGVASKPILAPELVEEDGAKILPQINTAEVMNALKSSLNRKIKPEIFDQLPKADAEQPVEITAERVAEK